MTRKQFFLCLGPDGNYSSDDGGGNLGAYTGWWHWDRKTRMLRVSESNNNGQTWLNWEVRLDEKLSGSTQFGVGITTRLRKIQPIPQVE